MRILPAIILTLGISASILASYGAETDITDVLELSVDDNLALPAVPQKAHTYIAAAMDQLRRHLVKNGLEAEMLRDGEVIELTVPASDLFGSGSCTLRAAAAERLRPLGMVVRDPDRYKVLVAVHTDDTGDDQYADSISAARANAIDDLLWRMADGKDTNVIPYGLGKDEPRLPNTSILNRAANRRVEIFIVPEAGLLEMAGVKRKQ